MFVPNILFGSAAQMTSVAPFRITISRWLALGSVVLMGFVVVSLIVAWGLAARDGWLPGRWGEADGNHGPWRHFYPGRMLVEQTLMDSSSNQHGQILIAAPRQRL